MDRLVPRAPAGGRPGRARRGHRGAGVRVPRRRRTQALAAAHALVDRSAEPELTGALWRVHAEHLAWRGDTAAARDAVDRRSRPGPLRPPRVAAAHPDGRAPGRGGRRRAAGRVGPRAGRAAGWPRGDRRVSADDLPDVRLGPAPRAAESARARGADAEPWAAVVTLAREVGRPYRLAYALLRLAEHELATGARRAAAEHLAEAHAAGEHLAAHRRRGRGRGGAGAGSGGRRAAAGRADATGDAVRAHRARQEVLHLLADGATNRQVARALFISERTGRARLAHPHEARRRHTSAGRRRGVPGGAAGLGTAAGRP